MVLRRQVQFMDLHFLHGGMGGIFGPMLANALSYQTLLIALSGIYGLSLLAVKKCVKTDKLAK